MLQPRIVEPALVVKAALQQAVSRATMLMSAGTLVLPRTSQKSYSS